MFSKLLNCNKASSIQTVDNNEEYEVVFREDFEKLDRDRWNFDVGNGPNHDGWGNGEQQTYTDSTKNAYIDDSVLNIKITKEDKPTADGLPYTSARLNTKGKFSFTFGRVEARVRLKTHVNGPFSAMWLLSDQIDSKGWPMCGEIDFFEYQGLWDYTPSTLHFFEHNGTGQPGQPISFHGPLYPPGKWFDVAIEWTPEYIAFFQDGKEVGRYNRPENPTQKNWPYHEGNKFHLVLNNAMQPFWSKEPPLDFTEHIMEIDHIVVLQKKSVKT